MIFAYLSVNSFRRTASNPGPPAVIRTVCGLSCSRCATVSTACGRAGRARPARVVVGSLMVASLLNGPGSMLAGARGTARRSSA
jgi:hypothetical protein